VPRAPKTSASTSAAGGGSPKAGAARAKKASKAKPAVDAEKAVKAHDGEDGEELEAGAAPERERDEDGEAAPPDDDAESEPASVSGARGSEPAPPDDEAFAEPRDSDVEVDAGDADGEVHSAPLSRDLARGVGSSMERLDPMAAYLREIQRHPLLTPEETHDLASKFITTQDPALAARLVTANLRLVVKIAYEYRRAYKNIMDLVQEGNIGLMQAVKRYDPYRGVKLSSYAAWWIRAYILRFILNNWRLVKLGTTQAQRKLFFNLRKKRSELQAMGIDPTNEEIARQLNVPETDVAEMDVRLAQSEKSLDAPVGDADGRAIAKVDMMPSVGAGPETQMADNELQALVKDKLAEFRSTLIGKDKDLAIFDLRLVADDPLTLQDLGDRFGISRERVRQLEQRLLGRLRDYLKREMGDATDSL
jgi:RNA polymerase sigma-32 factor